MLEIIALERAVSEETYKFILEIYGEPEADKLLFDPRELDVRYDN